LLPLLDSPFVFWLVVVYLCAAFFVTMTWYFPQLEGIIPAWLTRLIYPIDKTDFDVLRFAISLRCPSLRCAS
jgi:OpgC protein